MIDLIRRAEAREAIEKLMEIHFDRQVVLAKARDAIVSLPSAEAVEVVRCKDCKHRYLYISENGTRRYYVCDFMDAQYESDGFCHHGERRKDEGD